MAESPRNKTKWDTRLPVIRDVLLIGVALLVLWKLFSAEWVIDPTQFPLSDLVSVVLAIFAISLSALFYFKATEASNRFYDNTHKFTRDVSEILGRIEAGFGERLRHLDEGYASLRDHVTRIPFDTGQAEEDIRAEEREVEKIKKERDELIQKLAERAKLHENERSQLFERLAEMDSELESSRREIELLLDQLHSARHGDEQKSLRLGSAERWRRMRSYSKKTVLDTLKDVTGVPVHQTPRSRLRAAFREVVDQLHPQFLDDMQIEGFADAEGTLTAKGTHFLRELDEPD